MSSSREDSPDWLRCFQVPPQSVLTLSSDSGSSPSPSHSHSPSPSPSKGDDRTDSLVPLEDSEHKAAPGQSGAQSSFNKISETKAPIEGTGVLVDRALPKKKKGRGSHDDAEVAEKDMTEKHVGAQASKSSLPLVLSEKVHRTKALIECEGDSIDLSGDMGAVGRVMIPDTPSGNCDMFLDLKGTIYRTTIVPSRTFCVMIAVISYRSLLVQVNFGPSEAKIEAIMNDFIQLSPQSNVYEAETMVEGTLEGFSFDSEEEAETMPKAISRLTDQSEGNGEQTDSKPKGKSDKISRTRKKGGVGLRNPQPAKKQRKKTQVTKKAKTKK